MANNCYNYITITGEKTEIASFKLLLQIEANKGQDNEDIYLNLQTDFGKFEKDPRWFNFDVHTADDEETITISGDSAWIPALELFTAISQRFQSFQIRYEYDEMGCDFSGWADISQGECTDNSFAYWEGQIQMHGEEQAFTNVIENELESYESEEELKESDMYLSFSEDKQAEILENYNN
jgi:hypothetical protein